MSKNREFFTIGEIKPDQRGPVTVEGLVSGKRVHKEVAFVDFGGFMSYVLQVVTNDLDAVKIAVPGAIALTEGVLTTKRLKDETNPLGGLELQASRFEVLQLPDRSPDYFSWVDVRDGRVALNQFNYNELIRKPEYYRVIDLKRGLEEAFITHFKREGFTPINVPGLTTSIVEGKGAEVFTFSGYAGRLSLIQSPQQIKQIMAGLHEKVVWTGSAYRNDPSDTRWHLAEFTGLDIEMQTHYLNKNDSLQEVMEKLTGATGALINEMARHHSCLTENNARIPFLPREGIPQVTFQKAWEFTGKPHDFSRKEEKKLGDYIKETTGSDFYFITHFPFKEKAFYTDTLNPGDPNTLSYSFDLIYKGVEISSGGLRVVNPQQLEAQMKAKGINPNDCQLYLDHFKRGAMQTGGFGMGLERILAILLGTSSKVIAAFPKTAKLAIG